MHALAATETRHIFATRWKNAAGTKTTREKNKSERKTNKLKPKRLN